MLSVARVYCFTGCFLSSAAASSVEVKGPPRATHPPGHPRAQMSKSADDKASEAVPKLLNVNVGVLGHVDSGKTSLVKAISTNLSTASLDKHPQSQERGITLDLVSVHSMRFASVRLVPRSIYSP